VTIRWSFELAEEDVLGQRTTVFRDRHRSLRSLLDASLEFGDRDYLVDGDRRISYAAHHAAVARVARWLTAQGVGKGDRVAILGRNSIEWVVTFWAGVSVGAIAVGLNAWWSPAELEHGIADCDATLLLDDMSVIRPLVDAGDVADLPDVDVDEDDPAVIIYTSGTTGRAKGATHSHRNLVGLVQAQRCVTASRVPAGVELPPARILATTPLFHVAGLHSGVVAALGAGSTVIWQPGRFDPDETLALIQRELNPRLTVAGMLLTMHDARTKLGQDVEREVRAHFPALVFDTVIPRNVRLGEAPSYGLPVIHHDPHCAGSEAYFELAKEVAARG
jgi:acyl-CoA synthetase (AMP-forming)/AMP-acid ligase II